MTKVENKIWFITGISRGFGLELAKAVLAEGDVVIGTSRDGKTKIESAPETNVLPLEITTPGHAAQVVKQAFSIHGRIDVMLTMPDMACSARSRKQVSKNLVTSSRSIFLGRYKSSRPHFCS
jgi:NADP-dependent 3-hydroxy acid dehydrogenase YdfG